MWLVLSSFAMPAPAIPQVFGIVFIVGLIAFMGLAGALPGFFLRWAKTIGQRVGSRPA